MITTPNAITAVDVGALERVIVVDAVSPVQRITRDVERAVAAEPLAPVGGAAASAAASVSPAGVGALGTSTVSVAGGGTAAGAGGVTAGALGPVRGLLDGLTTKETPEGTVAVWCRAGSGVIP